MSQPSYTRLKDQFTGAGGVYLIVGIPPEQPTVETDGSDDEEDPDSWTQGKLIDLFDENHNNGYKTLCIIDDLMIDARKGGSRDFVDKLFTSGRHKGVDVWQLTQAHTDSRTRRLQVGYLICFATPADVSSLAHIARSVRPETKGHDVLAAYRTATESYDGHGCLIICLNQPNDIMFRNTRMDECFDLNALPVDDHGNTCIGSPNTYY